MNNWTPLHTAAAEGRTEVALELVGQVADKNSVAGNLGTPLHRAAIKGHLVTLRALLEHGCSLDILTPTGRTVLHHAAQGGNVPVINELIDRGCKVDVTDKDNWTPLHIAAAMGRTEAALELIRRGADKTIVAIGLGTPLHQAAVEGHLITLRALLEHGCSLDVPTASFTILHAAAAGGNVPVINELIDRGCDINATDDDHNCTPLHIAATEGRTEAALELIRRGADKAIVAGSLGTPLHQAAIKGHLVTLRALLEHGCSLDILTTTGCTVLHHAAEGGNVPVINELIDRGCNVDATDNNNLTPLHCVATAGRTEAALTLIRCGADKTIVAGRFGTPLHQAANKGHLGTIRALLEHGCSLNIRTTTGRTVLHHGASGGSVTVINELIDRGCNVDATDDDNWTPLHSAAANGRTEAALELIRRGADKTIVAGSLGTPLHQAAIGGHLITLRALLEHGCSLDILTPTGYNVLHHAAEGGNVDIMKELIDRGCNVDATDDDNWTPLHSAAANGRTEAALELIRQGADKTIVAGRLGTPLHRAANRGHLTTLRALLDHGCSLDILTTAGCTVLHHAALGGNVPVINELIDRGCNVDATDEDNTTPLHCAVRLNTEAALILIKQSHNLYTVAGINGTVFDYVCFFGNMEIILTIMELSPGIINSVNSIGGNCLHAAAAANRVEVIQFLINCGMPVNALDLYGLSPLHYAAESGGWESYQLLVKNGANENYQAPVFGTPLTFANMTGRIRIPKHFHQKDMKLFNDISIVDQFPSAIGVTALEFFITRNLSNKSDSERYLQASQLLKSNLSSVNIHNIIGLAALLGEDGILDLIDSYVKENQSLMNQAMVTESTITAQSVRWIFKLLDTEPIMNTTLTPMKTLSPLHLAMLSKKFTVKGSHVFLHMIPRRYLHFTAKLLSSSFCSDIYCRRQSGKWPIHPIHLADHLQLHDIASCLHKAGLGQIYLPLETNTSLTPNLATMGYMLQQIKSSGTVSSREISIFLKMQLSSLQGSVGVSNDEDALFERKPEVGQLIKHIVNGVHHNYDEDEIENLALCLDIPLSVLTDTQGMSMKKVLKTLLIYWLKNSKRPTWNKLLDVLDDYETSRTMKAIRKQLHEDLYQITESSNSCMLVGRPSIALKSNFSTHTIDGPWSQGPPIPQLITIQSLPTERDLTDTVVPTVHTEWYNFGLYLGVKSNVLDGIGMSKRPHLAECCMDVVKHWLNYIQDSGQKRRNWNTVLIALKKTVGKIRMEKILDKLEFRESELSYEEFTNTDPIQVQTDVPELVDLVEHVVPLIEDQWEKIAISLGLSLVKVTSIGRDFHWSSHCCRDALNHLLCGREGTISVRTLTWQLLLDAVSEYSGPVVVHKIKQALRIEQNQ